MLDWLSIDITDNFNYFIKIPTQFEERCALHEAIKTVNFICEKYPPPYILYVSGGIDSQAMLWAWHNSGKEYQAISYTYNTDMNLHDLDVGMPEFLNRHEIRVERRNIDLLSFYKNEYLDYHKFYRCGSPHICAYMYMADQQKEGTVIFSGSNQGFYSKNEWGLYTYGKLSGKSIVPFFFSETKNLHFNIRYPYTKTKIKSETYLSQGFPIILQGNTRYSGFENIKDYYDKNYSHLVTKKAIFNRVVGQKSVRTYDLILRNSFELEYSSDKYQVCYI